MKALKGGAVCTVETLEADGRKEGAEPAEETIEVQIGAEASNTTRIGAMLSATLRGKLIAFLRQNSDVFAWTPADMPGVPAEVIIHQLKVNKAQKLVKQKRRHFANERMAAIEEEVRKLLEAGFIREEKYPDVVG